MWVGRPGFLDFATAWTSNRTVSLLKPLLRGLVRIFGSRPLLRVFEVWPGTALSFFCCSALPYKGTSAVVLSSAARAPT